MLLAAWAGSGARGLSDFPPIMMRLCGIGTRLFRDGIESEARRFIGCAPGH